MRRSLAAVFGGWILLLCVPVAAQDAVLGQMYGSGVHSYFSQDYLKAYQYFTTAIDAHTQDPRCFYFRGLTYTKLGRPQDAELDFKEGAKLETNIDPARSFGVARSLERIQGPERATLEQFRLEARAAMLKKGEDEQRIRYDKTRAQTRDFLDKESKPADTIEKVNPPAGSKAAVDPFNPGVPDTKKDETPAVTKPADKAPESLPEKPAEGAKPAAPGDDPFGAKPATPDKATPDSAMPKPDDSAPATPAKTDGADPFGGSGNATPPPKKADAKSTPAATSPAASSPAADAADPFGAAGAAPPAKKADAKPAPAADGADPFGAADAPKADAPKAGTAKADAPAAPAKKADAKAGDNPFQDEPAKKDAAPADKAAPAKKDADKKPDADPFG